MPRLGLENMSLTIRTRLIGGFACVVALTVVIGAVVYWGLWRLNVFDNERQSPHNCFSPLWLSSKRVELVCWSSSTRPAR